VYEGFAVFVLRLFCVFVAVFVFVAFPYVSPVLAGSDQDTAFSVLVVAEDAVLSAYDAVIEAELVGGNVSSLTVQLNEAGELLASARMSYRDGDFEKATLFADLSRSTGEEVEDAAYELKGLAWDAGFQRLRFTMVGSVSGIILVILGSLWVWRFFKRWFYPRVLKMKPEVTSDDS